MEPFTILDPTDRDLENGAREAAETFLGIIQDGVPTGPKIKEDPEQKGKRWTLEDPDITKPLARMLHTAKVCADTNCVLSCLTIFRKRLYGSWSGTNSQRTQQYFSSGKEVVLESWRKILSASSYLSSLSNLLSSRLL